MRGERDGNLIIYLWSDAIRTAEQLVFGIPIPSIYCGFCHYISSVVLLTWRKRRKERKKKGKKKEGALHDSSLTIYILSLLVLDTRVQEGKTCFCRTTMPSLHDRKRPNCYVFSSNFTTAQTKHSNWYYILLLKKNKQKNKKQGNKQKYTQNKTLPANFGAN